ncbi:hypothetical protein [Weissella confusa]|uniref:hypothetical protein n=1 Tax=Weissella confusa TaxID=1583 RepID=UPI001436B632|nr:hypothetical protein [Weissella confusa]MBJ7635352.1 hypothetical protein [Weissella confusa]
MAVGYAVFAILMLVMFVAWLFDFLDVHDINLRPQLEEKIKEATDDQDDCSGIG